MSFGISELGSEAGDATTAFEPEAFEASPVASVPAPAAQPESTISRSAVIHNDQWPLSRFMLSDTKPDIPAEQCSARMSGLMR